MRLIVPFQGARQVDRFLRHLRVKLLQITNFVRQRMPLLRFFAKTLLNTAAKTVQLLTQRRQQAIQALSVLFVYATITVFKDTVRQIFKLLA